MSKFDETVSFKVEREKNVKAREYIPNICQRKRTCVEGN